MSQNIMDWTKDYFDEIYLKYFLEAQSDELTAEQVKFIESIIVTKSTILDAGCGIGRHSLLLAKHSYKVTGIDSSQIYIDRANSLKEKEKLDNCEFSLADVRTLEIENKFDAVLSLWSSFGYFDDETNVDILKRFKAALKDEGIIIVDVENRDYILKYFIYETFNKKDDVYILERRKFHPLTSQITTHRYFVGKNIDKDYFRCIRLYTATELISIYKQLGFKNIRVFGDYNGEKFHLNSQRIIIAAQKA
jgi:SAM-dependent methyltransferase